MLKDELLTGASCRRPTILEADLPPAELATKGGVEAKHRIEGRWPVDVYLQRVNPQLRGFPPHTRSLPDVTRRGQEVVCQKTQNRGVLLAEFRRWVDGRKIAHVMTDLNAGAWWTSYEVKPE